MKLTEQVYCWGPGGWTLRCRRLRHLIDVMCVPYSGYPHDELYIEHERDSGQEGHKSVALQETCFGLPEVANGQLTGLVDEHDQCEFKGLHYHLTDKECKDKNTLKYRTIDGSCNNLHNPTWGKSFEPQRRLLPAQYFDDNLPRNESESGQPLPNPRVISLSISSILVPFANVTNMVMAWGQFIDHDFTGTPMIKNGSKNIMCCGDIAEELRVENGGPCFTIPIPYDDPLNRTCMQFVRSVPDTVPDGMIKLPREQINSLTSFLDGSVTYGNTAEQLTRLRGDKGKLKVTERNLLPENPSGKCKKETANDYCMLAGDSRVNVFVGLGALHTAFVREHNRIVHVFKQINPHWDSERRFQEARKIISAQLQRVTYAEWLPLVLDDVTLDHFRLREGDFEYDKTIDPTVVNVFSTAVFRFGHSQVKQIVKIGTHGLNQTLQDSLMRPTFVLSHMADVIRGLASDPTDKVDSHFADGLINHMFETSPNTMDGLDLMSLNIQRGRDHGLPPFNDWRELCGLARITDLDSPELTVNLTGVYQHVADIDVFVGLMAEVLVEGSLVGPTLNCLLGTQFRDIKLGDRFFYETQSTKAGFTEDQLKEIKKVTLSRILCDTNPELGEIQENVFKLEDPESNPMRPCDSLPAINLRKWAEKKRGYRYYSKRKHH